MVGQSYSQVPRKRYDSFPGVHLARGFVSLERVRRDPALASFRYPGSLTTQRDVATLRTFA